VFVPVQSSESVGSCSRPESCSPFHVGRTAVLSAAPLSAAPLSAAPLSAAPLSAAPLSSALLSAALLSAVRSFPIRYRRGGLESARLRGCKLRQMENAPRGVARSYSQHELGLRRASPVQFCLHELLAQGGRLGSGRVASARLI
jgi:hypothetical protein